MKLSSSLIFCMGLIASAAALPAVTLSPAQKSATIAPLSATVFNTHGQNVRGTVPDVTDLTKDIVAVEAAGDSRDITKRETANAATDRLLFSESLSNFLYYKSIQSPGGLDWSDDGCSNSPDNPGKLQLCAPAAGRIVC